MKTQRVTPTVQRLIAINHWPAVYLTISILIDLLANSIVTFARDQDVIEKAILVATAIPLWATTGLFFLLAYNIAKTRLGRAYVVFGAAAAVLSSLIGRFGFKQIPQNEALFIFGICCGVLSLLLNNEDEERDINPREEALFVSIAVASVAFVIGIFTNNLLVWILAFAIWDVLATPISQRLRINARMSENAASFVAFLPTAATAAMLYLASNSLALASISAGIGSSVAAFLMERYLYPTTTIKGLSMRFGAQVSLGLVSIGVLSVVFG